MSTDSDPDESGDSPHESSVEIKTSDFHGVPEFAIVVPIADPDDDITRLCVDHLVKNVTTPFRLILVASRGSAFSYGRSINAGIEAASSFDLIVGMDSDAFPDRGTVEKTIRYARKDPRLGYVGAKIVQCNGKPPNIGWVLQNIWWYLINSVRNLAPRSALKRILMGKWWSFSVRVPSHYVPRRMVGIITTFFVIKRECFDEVGPFDESFRYSFVDVDYSFRILTSRWYVSVCPQASVLHRGHATATRRLQEEEFEGWNRYLSKWSRERIKEVRKAARESKFIIPGDLE
ncbi:MAG: glycosyltransferase [Methanomassiliicoccales archaeon]|nr:glycosyltransferase [Methanomassiliicoccales archaeon]